MQHHALQRTALALAPMRPATLGLLQQTLGMQEGLRPGVAPAEVVVLHQTLVEMLGREPGVTRAIQHLHFLAPVRGNPLARRLAQPPIQQARLALVLKALAPAPERPLAHPQQFPSLELAQLRGLVTAQNAHKLDHPHTLMGFRPAHPFPPRRDQTLPDRSCAT